MSSAAEPRCLREVRLRKSGVLRIRSMSASTAGWIAIAAVVLALVALIAWGWTLVLLSRARAAQRVLLGGRKQDLVDFAVSLQARIDDVLGAGDEIAGARSRGGPLVGGAVSKGSMARYDALSDVGGHQSATLAMLDASRTGVV